MELTLTIQMQVTDDTTASQITDILNEMLPFMADNVEIEPSRRPLHTFSPLYLEREIRDMATAVINDCLNRAARPSYGYTKTEIRRKYARLEGMAALYAYLTGQTLNALSIPLGLVKFLDSETTERILRAKQRVEAL